MTNTSKVRAIIAALITGIASFVSWLVALPPEQQTSLLYPLVELFPLHSRDEVGLFTRGLASVSIIYAAFSAAKSGPATPPQNPTSE